MSRKSSGQVVCSTALNYFLKTPNWKYQRRISDVDIRHRARFQTLIKRVAWEELTSDSGNNEWPRRTMWCDVREEWRIEDKRTESAGTRAGADRPQAVIRAAADDWTHQAGPQTVVRNFGAGRPELLLDVLALRRRSSWRSIDSRSNYTWRKPLFSLELQSSVVYTKHLDLTFLTIDFLS